MTGNMLEFDSPKEQSSYIKVIGVGGGGSNAVNNMYQQGIQGVDFIVCNTDMKALNNSPVPNKIILGELGAGNIPEEGRKAALEHKDDIRGAIANNTQMLFITAGMGGGTGTGAAPVIAEIAKQIELVDDTVKHILVVAIVTVPFKFEGRRRQLQAENGIEELKKHVDSILVINNDKLRQLGNLPFSEAFKQADNVLYTAVKGIAEIITVSAYVNIDFHDVNTVMENSGTALMGAGVGTGEGRAMAAITAASTSVLLNDNDISGAKNILLYFSYSPNYEISMDELGEVTDYITQLTGNFESDVIWGAGADDSLGDELKITLIATGFDKKITGDTSSEETRVFKLDTQKKVEPKPEIPQHDGEMHVFTREPQSQDPVQAEANPIVENTTPAVAAAVATTVLASEVASQVAPQPVQQPVQQSIQQPVQHAENTINVGHRYTLEDTEVIEQYPNPTVSVSDADQGRQNVYADGINIVNHSVQDAVQEKPVEVQPTLFQQMEREPVQIQQPVVEVKQPVVESQQSVESTVNHIPFNQPEQQVPTAEVLEPILSVAQKSEPVQQIVSTPEAVAVSVEEAPAVETIERQTEDPDQAALNRARKIERIRTLHDLLRNKPDGPAIVENMRTEEFSDEDIYRAPHSSESEAHGATIDRKGNMKSINNFLFGRPD